MTKQKVVKKNGKQPKIPQRSYNPQTGKYMVVCPNCKNSIKSKLVLYRMIKCNACGARRKK